MEIGDRIKQRREELGMSQEELATLLGYKSRSSINKIELNQRNLTQPKIKLIADALQTTPGYIMGWEDNIVPSPQVEEEEVELPSNVYPMPTMKSFPVLGAIACGAPIYAEENYDDCIYASDDIRADFCLRCKGDSMINARINDGDIVFIRQQPDVRDGEIAAVLIEDEATLKRVYHNKHGVTLVAENPIYSPMVFVESDLLNIRILGKAVAFQSSI